MSIDPHPHRSNFLASGDSDWVAVVMEWELGLVTALAQAQELAPVLAPVVDLDWEKVGEVHKHK